MGAIDQDTIRTLYTAMALKVDGWGDEYHRKAVAAQRDGQLLQVRYFQGGRDAFQVVAGALLEAGNMPVAEQQEFARHLSLLTQGDLDEHQGRG